MENCAPLLRAIAAHVLQARLSTGARLLDTTDFREWLIGLAEKAERADTLEQLLPNLHDQELADCSVAMSSSLSSESTAGSDASSTLEQAIVELQRLHEILLAGDLEPRVLADFRDALNRVRTAAWAAQQSVIRNETEQDSNSVLSFLVGERIRATYQLCQAISDDLKRTDIDFQAGSLIQLQEVAEALTEQLNSVIDKRG